MRTWLTGNPNSEKTTMYLISIVLIFFSRIIGEKDCRI